MAFSIVIWRLSREKSPRHVIREPAEAVVNTKI
jgi:hypothetical protein